MKLFHQDSEATDLRLIQEGRLTLFKSEFGRKTMQFLNVRSNRKYFWLGAIKLGNIIHESTSNDLIYKPKVLRNG